jgi:hypothetical protein
LPTLRYIYIYYISIIMISIIIIAAHKEDPARRPSNPHA